MPIPIGVDLDHEAGAAAHHHPVDDDPGQVIDTTRLHRVAGLTGARTAVVTTRRPSHPLRCELISGGQVPTPGDVSRAHHGVRCLGELPEFRRHVLEVLRQPLEDGVVTIARA